MKDYPDSMTAAQARTFRDDVLNIVSQIPCGSVTTYGIIAAWAGWPSHSRMVGRTLRYTPGAELLPCHRVVNIEGRTAPGWSRQRALLESEGVTFRPNGHVDMQRHLWQPALTPTGADVPLLLSYDMGDGVTAFSTTRHGGCSTGRYAQFNINRYCGDEAEHIATNRDALCRLLGIGPDCLLMPHQTHGTCVATIDHGFLALGAAERQAALEGVDALMTNCPGVCIGVSTADCIPLLLYDPRHRAVCAVHAGWRGTVGRIAHRAVDAMKTVYGSQPAELVAQIGPGISIGSFEVGQEVYDAFAQAGFEMEALSRRYPSMADGQTEKWHIDLPECNRRQLLASGLPQQSVSCCGVCTYQQHDTFFSARRLGIRSGRIFTGIMLKRED